MSGDDNKKAFKEYYKCLKKVIGFLKPIEEKYTGTGLPALFSFLACRTGAGVIATNPMGGGKTLTAKLVEYLMSESGSAEHIVPFQEFKKTDWFAMFPESPYEETFFHFSIQEISAVGEYSENLFWEKVPALQSDGDFLYRAGKDPSEWIVMENCEASYFVASQPPKTHRIINNETFRTLANDRCWNIIIINQMRGRENVPIREAGEVIRAIKWERKHKGEQVKRYFFYPDYQIGFEKVGTDKKVRHLTRSGLDLSEFEDIIRNQYSVDRREEQMNDILRSFGAFLSVKTIRQVHIRLFLDLFGFYIALFNRLTVGSVEQSINIRYGAVEMLCRISALISRGRLVTQDLLTKEFNAEEGDIKLHLSELVQKNVLRRVEPKRKRNTKRVNRAKTDRAVREQTKVLETAGIIEKRFATKRDARNKDVKKPRQAVYEFTSEINDFFRLYASILTEFLSKKELSKIPQVSKFLGELSFSGKTSEVKTKPRPKRKA